MFIQLLAIIGIVFAFILATLSVAAGLYYFSELIEENLVLTKKLLKNYLLVISAFQILLTLFDSFPWKLSLFTLFTNYIYSFNLVKFPDINFFNPLFLFSIFLAFINHLLWFNYFNNPFIPTIDQRLDPDFILPYYPNFSEIASFFGLAIWLFPFSLFISISSNENGLPLSNSNSSANANNNNNKSSIIKSIINFISSKLNLSLSRQNNHNVLDL